MKNQKNKPAHNRVDYSGMKKNKLTAIKFVDIKHHKSRWLFKCDCGVKKVIPAYRVKNNIIKSCGCIKGDKKHISFEKRLYHIYKRAAQKRNISWNLTQKHFKFLTKQNCYYCGSPPTDSYKNIINNYSRPVNGVDRKNSSIGYSKKNCAPCCKTCNTMKMDLSHDEFIEQCKLISKKFE